MNDLIESLIHQFKKQRIIRGNIYDNFMFFSYKTLGADKDDKYKHTRASILCLLYTSPSPRDVEEDRMPSSA